MNTPTTSPLPGPDTRSGTTGTLHRGMRAALAATILAAMCGCAGYSVEFANTHPDSMKRLFDPYDARSTVNIWTVN